MLTVKFGNKFKKDYKQAQKRGLDIDLLKKVVDMLAKQVPLPAEYREHYLTNINRQHRLVYQVLEEEKIVKIISLWLHYENM